MDLAQGLNCIFCPSLALDPLGHHAITCEHGGMWFPATINSVMFLWSVVGELMYLPRLRLAVALGVTNATPDQQMFWFPTGLLGSQLHLIIPLPHR